MSQPNQPPQLFRYFLTTSAVAFDGSLLDGHIRLEWTDNAGIRRASLGAFSDGAITWTYQEPPAALASAALECVYGDDVPATEFGGYQTEREMDFEVCRVCRCCGSSQPSEDWLSRDGHCGRCFTSQMAEVA